MVSQNSPRPKQLTHRGRPFEPGPPSCFDGTLPNTSENS